MPATSAVGLGRSATAAAPRNNILLSGFVRPSSAPTRPVCRPVLLAPGPRSPRRHRARLVTKNFQKSHDGTEESPIWRQKPLRHPLTEDPFAGASSSETATQEVLFSGVSSAAAAAAAPQTCGLFGSTATAARQVAHLLTRPRALLRAVARNVAPFGVPLLLVFIAREPLVSFWAFYSVSLESHPLFTKIATGVVGAVLGDYVAQKIGYEKEVQEAKLHGKPTPPFVFDVMRTSRLAIYGALVGTPVGHAWFQLLDTHVMPEAMTSPQAVLTKMFMDQALMSPASTALFFVVMRCWDGHSNDAVPYMLAKMVPTLKANYLLWPIAHIINFAFVPPTQRILYCNAVGLIWTVILSTILNSNTPSASVSTSGSSSGADPIAWGGAGAGGSRSGSPTPGGAGASVGQADTPRHAHAAFTPGLALGTIDTVGRSGGFSGNPQQLVDGRKGVPQPGISATAFVRPAQWETNGKDA